jgi:hypothetical protein
MGKEDTMEKEDTNKTGTENNAVKDEQKRSWYEFCQSRCKGYFNPEEMKDMFVGCCDNMSASDKKGSNWQAFCKCMPSVEKTGEKQNDCC